MVMLEFSEFRGVPSWRYFIKVTHTVSVNKKRQNDIWTLTVYPIFSHP